MQNKAQCLIMNLSRIPTLFFILIVGNSAVHSSVSLTDGLIAHYTFTGNLNDSSISANNLTSGTIGAFLDTDRFGNNLSALRLSTTFDFAKSDKNIALAGNVSHTISVWLKSAYSNNYYGTGTIIQFGDPSQIGGVNALKIQSGASGSVQMWGQYADYNAPNLGYIFSNWTQIVYTYSDNIFNSAFYINGSSASPGFAGISGMYLTETYNLTSTPMKIGYFGSADASSDPYYDFASGLANGLVDDIRIYDRALSGTEVQQLYALESAPEPSALSLLAVGLGVVLRRRRRTV